MSYNKEWDNYLNNSSPNIIYPTVINHLIDYVHKSAYNFRGIYFKYNFIKLLNQYRLSSTRKTHNEYHQFDLYSSDKSILKTLGLIETTKTGYKCVNIYSWFYNTICENIEDFSGMHLKELEPIFTKDTLIVKQTRNYKYEVARDKVTTPITIATYIESTNWKFKSTLVDDKVYSNAIERMLKTSIDDDMVTNTIVEYVGMTDPIAIKRLSGAVFLVINKLGGYKPIKKLIINLATASNVNSAL